MRKHRKQGIVKSDVNREVITPEKEEVKIAMNPATGEFEARRVVTPAVFKQGRAKASTIDRGMKNGQGTVRTKVAPVIGGRAPR